MARIQTSEIESLPDILSTEHFTLNLGNIPGGGAAYPLLLKCLNTSITGIGNEAYTVPLAGTERNFRGRKTYGSRSLTATFVEDATLQTLTALRVWHEYIVGTNSNVSTGNGIVDYSVNATLTIYNQSGVPIDAVNYWSLFLANIGEVPVTGESSGVMQIQAEFKFDYATFANVPIF